MKREFWNESELTSLPLGEHDYFERKSAELLNDSDFREKMAKAISAFANSGGGHLIIGIRDDGRIDGVHRIHKGRQPTREWLEQIIPELVSYPLQDFRVHEVVPQPVSAIPADRLVIVVDIGDSLQAPHQSAVTKIYHYRAGGKSERAPHHFLEMLRGRESYPSGKVAHTWLNFVIRPFLTRLETSYEALNNRRLEWNSRTNEMSPLVPFYVDHGQLSLNQIQFLEEYIDIKNDLNRHDAVIVDLTHEMHLFSKAIQDSGKFYELYKETINEQSLNALRAKYRFHDGETDDKLLPGLFGSMSEQERLRMLADHVVNNRSHLSQDKMVAPLWNERRDVYMRILADPDIATLSNRAFQQLKVLMEVMTSLISRMQTIRKELAIKFGEVYEDETLNTHAAGYGSSDFYWR